MTTHDPIQQAIEAMEAALAYDEAIRSCANDPDKMSSYCTAQGDDLDSLYFGWLDKSRAALAALRKAREGATEVHFTREIIEDVGLFTVIESIDGGRWRIDTPALLIPLEPSTEEES